MKSPLRYPGGKSRAVKLLQPLFPTTEDTILSPFFGGGSLELALAESGFNVKAFDGFEPLINFWSHLKSGASLLHSLCQDYLKDFSKDVFKELQKNQNHFSDVERAAIFFVLNRASFSGLTMSGGMCKDFPRFTQSSIDKLLKLDLTRIEFIHSDFKESISSNNDLAYIDPPYVVGEVLYGNSGCMHKGFDHESLYELLKDRKQWVLSYNNCEYILEKYKDFEILFPNWKYGMSKDKTSKEVLILSHDMC